jgi:energy-converting hydrogenase B subunit D
MTGVQAVALVLVAASGAVVVAVREPARQAVASGLFGLCLAILFFTFQAPDVALSQIVVGGVALPAMILLALGKVRRREVAQRAAGEGGESSGDRGAR